MSKQFQELIQRARTDPQFFHDLAFNPSKIAAQFADAGLKEAVLGLNPNSIFGRIAVGAGLQWCGDTCGSSSCIDTCGSRSCDNTCADSCGTTCSHSCGITTKVVLSRLGREGQF
jgi:hypothetical protein